MTKHFNKIHIICNAQCYHYLVSFSIDSIIQYRNHQFLTYLILNKLRTMITKIQKVVCPLENLMSQPHYHNKESNLFLEYLASWE